MVFDDRKKILPQKFDPVDQMGFDWMHIFFIIMILVQISIHIQTDQYDDDDGEMDEFEIENDNEDELIVWNIFIFSIVFYFFLHIFSRVIDWCFDYIKIFTSNILSSQ